MTDAVLLPEMVEAGLEAMLEGERQGLDPYQKVVVVWMAMKAIEAMSEIKIQETLH